MLTLPRLPRLVYPTCHNYFARDNCLLYIDSPHKPVISNFELCARGHLYPVNSYLYAKFERNRSLSTFLYIEEIAYHTGPLT